MSLNVSGEDQEPELFHPIVLSDYEMGLLCFLRRRH